MNLELFSFRLALAAILGIWTIAGMLFLNALVLASIADIIKHWKP